MNEVEIVGYDETGMYIISRDKATNQYLVKGTTMWSEIFWAGLGALATWFIMKK